MGWMLFRLALSLAFVAALLFFAARVAKKRGLGRSAALIEVLARQPLSRTSSVNVIRVAGRVMVIGATEGQITLLGEVDNAEVEAEIERTEADALEAGTVRRSPGLTPVGTGIAAGSVFDRTQWSALLHALRERTVRRS